MLNATQYNRVKAFFIEAETKSAEEQAKVIEQACREDPSVGEELQLLLKSDVAASSFLLNPPDVRTPRE